MLQRIQALTSLLDSALAESEQHPERPLPGLAVTFAATQVQVFAPLLPFKSTFLRSFHSSIYISASLLPLQYKSLPSCSH